MISTCHRTSILLASLLFSLVASVQSALAAPASVPSLNSIPMLPFNTSGPVIHAHVEPLKPFTVAGEHGVVLGQQGGSFEAWILPVKVLSHLSIQANISGYDVPIDVNQQAAEIEVRPDRTIITYSHIEFTIRQIMFSPNDSPAGTGPIVLFEFDCLHPTDFTINFTPNLEWMWPERNEGNPGAEWDARGGFYVLHSDYPDFAAAVTIPGAQPGILAPYQERPHFYPTQLKLHIDPARDRGRLYPLLMAIGTNTAEAENVALGAKLAQLNGSIASLYQDHAASYKKLFANSVSIETPDKSLDEAFQWAVISIEQLKAKPFVPASKPDPGHTESSAPENGTSSFGDETALVAGYYESGDSARPGFGWFFGRDALYTLYAVNGFGDFSLAKNELEFLIHRQREDGKIMHEYSQTAAAIDWRAFPYMYAAADSTPLFLLAVADYVRASGDTAFLTAHRDAIEKAWAFETDPAHDTDHDGIYDNSQGTGWVESWPGAMPHQEIYLALLDQQASSAMAAIEDLLGDHAKASTARERADAIAKTINHEYYDSERGCYAFATNPPGAPNSPVDRTKTVYPALAWWDPVGGKSILEQPSGCLSQFASAALNTDWGLRDVADNEKYYDGTSYHQGSVWPLFTGWAALAEYRGGQPLAGYQLLKENANLTGAQDLGADTELLSGDFYVPFGRSTSHQLWSSAMVIAPTLRGLFGISIDAQTKTITVNPRLPASWDNARVTNLPVPGGPDELTFARVGELLTVQTEKGKQAGWKLRSDMRGTEERESHPSSDGLMIALPLSPVEIADARAAWIDMTSGRRTNVDGFSAPAPGSRTERMRVVHEEWGDRSAKLTFEGPAAATGRYFIVRHRQLPNLRVSCPDLIVETIDGGQKTIPCTSMIDTAHRDPNLPIALTPQMPLGTGWQTLTVTLSW